MLIWFVSMLWLLRTRWTYGYLLNLDSRILTRCESTSSPVYCICQALRNACEDRRVSVSFWVQRLCKFILNWCGNWYVSPVSMSSRVKFFFAWQKCSFPSRLCIIDPAWCWSWPRQTTREPKYSIRHEHSYRGFPLIAGKLNVEWPV